ncbi:fibronectin type III domain-containing protein [bacterium]|nr:fibronectin type III domain-containing protein [bacterium]
MKFLIAAFVFFLTLGLTTKTIASEPEAATCTPETTEKCADTNAAHGTHAKTGHKDHSAEMNSLFPEKQQNPKLSVRPNVVEITAPKFLSKVTGPTKLEWKEARGANTYHVQVATDPNFKWLVAEDHLVKTNSFAFDKAEAGRKYFWRVAAYNTDNDSSFTKSNFTSSVFISK